MDAQFDNQRYDSYRVGDTSYVKDSHLGPKAWSLIQSVSPGRFIDIMESKFAAENETFKKIDINR